MKTHSSKQGALTNNSTDPDTVTRGMLRERAGKLAVGNGRPTYEASLAEWEQAKRELTGGPNGYSKVLLQWFEHGLFDLRPTVCEMGVSVLEEGAVEVSSTVNWKALQGARVSSALRDGKIVLTPESLPDQAAAFEIQTKYRIAQSGKMAVSMKILPSGPNLILARMGLAFALPQEFSQVRYSSEKPFSASVIPYSQMELTVAAHPHNLPKIEKTVVSLDVKHLGIGGASCGPPLLERDWVRADPTEFQFFLELLR